MHPRIIRAVLTLCIIFMFIIVTAMVNRSVVELMDEERSMVDFRAFLERIRRFRG
jgi:hypothetical protein